MSIELEYEKYCENCPNFKPVKEVTVSYGFGMTNMERFTVISCENKLVCDQMFDYLKEQEGLKWEE